MQNVEPDQESERGPERERHLELPPIYCPLPSAVHPRVREVHQRAADWLARSGLCATEREHAWSAASHSSEFFGRFVPTADDERLFATSLWIYWAFVFDDARCDRGELASRPDLFAGLAVRVQRALEAPDLPDRPDPPDAGPAADDPFLPPLRDVARRLRAIGTPTTTRRFAVAHRAWLSGVTWQIGNRARGHMPDLDEYLAMRLLTCGGEPTFGLLELATGGEVPGREFDRPVVRALTELAIAVAGLDNDRHSLLREARGGHSDQNIYTVLMRHDGLAPADAVAAATAIRDRVFNRFRQLLARVLPTAGPELRTYLSGLCHGIRGNAEWGQRVPRYLSTGLLPEDYGADDTPIEWADAPADPRTGPPPSPTVSWWWDDDLT
ncbi:terpene synthase family protein [Streptomyces sp. 4N509B]|uniref:terpene synthase family protein n=1 Tax=Streptomyces sp. 4N509B TaxID=3457413 RepID=UPI003FD63CA3